MSIWGKIIGGVGGFALGGPIGLLIGGLAGHAIDKARSANEETDGTKQIAFTIGVIVLGAKMAKADGVVTKDEIAAFREVFQVPPDELKNVSRVFNKARQDAQGFEPYAGQIANLFTNAPEVLEDLLHGLFHIAKADNVVHPAELEYLKSVAAIFGFTEHDFERIRAHHMGPDAADPYTILGVSRDASDDEIKKTYRQLIREHHPDRVIAKGLPQEFVDIANEKLAAINNAFDQVAKQRKIA